LDVTAPALLHSDERFELVDAALRRHQHQPSALIEVLRVAQDAHGYLSREVLRRVARGLRLPPSRVYGVATFYHLFALTPPGGHLCDVCLGTACYLKAGLALLAALERALGTAAGATQADGRVTLTTSRCVGSCGMAPLAVFDGAPAGPLTPAAALERVKGWLDGGPG
jgi:bidirectional [NiFe] hydrogenase diaphorase subunit